MLFILFGLSCNSYDRNIPLVFQIGDVISKDICDLDSNLVGYQLKPCKVVCVEYDSIRLSLYKLPCEEVLYEKPDIIGNYIREGENMIFDGSDLPFLTKADTFVIVHKMKSFTNYLLINTPDPQNKKVRIYYFSLIAFANGQKLQVNFPYSEL